jgi:hypothetical protein
VPASLTATCARSKRSAVQRNHHARSRAISMSTPETSPGRSLAPRTLSRRGRAFLNVKFCARCQFQIRVA